MNMCRNEDHLKRCFYNGVKVMPTTALGIEGGI